MSIEKSPAQLPNEPNEVKVTVTVVLNAFTWVEKPTKNSITYHSIVLIVLPFLALAAVFMNTCVLLAVVCSNSLKKTVLNWYVSVVSIACLLDCCVNVPFSLYFVRNQPSVSGVACNVNAAFVLFICTVTTWGVCGMCTERWLAVFERNRHRLGVFCKLRYCVAFQIFLAIGILLPLLFNEVRKFSDRISCSVALKDRQFYRIAILIFLFVPLALGLFAMLSTLIKNFRNIRNIGMQNIELSYAELFFEESHLWHEWQSSKFVACIVLLFLLLELPFIIRLTEPVPISHHTDLSQSNTTSNSVRAIQETSTADRVFFWCRIIFCDLFPCAAILHRKDIRRKMLSLMSLCKTGSTISIKPVEESSETVQEDDKSDESFVPQVWRRRRLSSVTCLSPPIVFGKARVSNSQFQLLDITSGIAKWKALYDESKKSRQNTQSISFFEDFFDDGDEVVEFDRYEDATEEELDSSEVKISSTVKEVAVQTTVNCCLSCNSSSTPFPSSSSSAPPSDNYRKGRINRHNRLSKSFAFNRRNSFIANRRNYLTYPKHPSKSNQQHNVQTYLTTTELLKALQVYRSRKYSAAANIIPRSTGELMDCTSEGTDIVSL